MIDLSLSDLIGGEPVTDIDEHPAQTSGPVWHVHLVGQPRKVFEKVIANTQPEAMEKAKDLLGDVGNVFVSGPHEHIAAK